jgi:CubicO group peptidase (beta-lactamase class C family)
MKMFLAMSLLFTLAASCYGYFAQETTAMTGAPVINSNEPATITALSETEYNRLLPKLIQIPQFVPIKRKPSGLTKNAKFGFNFIFAGLNRSWIVDGDKKKGFTLYADLNGNGDLSDDPLLKFQKRAGKYSLVYQKTIKEIIGNIENDAKTGAVTYPFKIILELKPEEAPEHNSPQFVLTKFDNTLRKGKIRLATHEVAFALAGSQGLYDDAAAGAVFFDINGDGKLETENSETAERVAVSEKYVNLDGKSYEFTVDRYGRSLTLKNITEKPSAHVPMLPKNSEANLNNISIDSIQGQTTAVDPVKLARLIERGRETNSDAVIVIQDGKVLAQEYYGKPIEPVYIASAGKSLVALAIGKLLDEGKIKSLDQPVSDFYPEWMQGNKKLITIKMLLNHTSGIQNVANASIEIERKNPPVNGIKLALAAELSNPPGTNWSYNNKAVALIAGIIEKASGKPMDTYFEESFYKPMNITSFKWLRDEDSNPTTYGAFRLEPMDLAKFGLLMLDGGQFEGKQIISRAFVEEAVKPSQSLFTACGLLWWRYPKTTKSIIDSERFAQMRKDGISEEFLKKIQPLENVLFESVTSYIAAMEKSLGKDWRQEVSKALEKTDYGLRKRIFGEDIIGFYAAGYRGNYLLIMPQYKLVALRVVRNDKDYSFKTDEFKEFVQLAAGLTGEKAGEMPIQ